MNIVVVSENTLVILFKQTIEHENFKVISYLVNEIKREMGRFIVDIIPSYASIHITFDVLNISGLDFKHRLNNLLELCNYEAASVESKTAIHIPVYYGEEVAFDLPFIADQARLTQQEVVQIHSDKVYDVYAIGFAPGFAYLGNVDASISTPRKETPRKKVAGGSLGIADQQTAIYPSESPGGWQIIGRTPVQLIDYSSDNLTQFSAGDKVKFDPISKAEYIELGGTL